MSHYSVVELDTPACPRSPQGYIPEFDHIVVIEEFFSIGLVDDGPNFPADFRKDFYFKKIVLEFNNFP